MTPPLTVNPHLTTCPLTTSEIEALAGMTTGSGKAAGLYGIPIELLKAGGGAVLRGPAAVFNKTWNTCEIPAD